MYTGTSMATVVESFARKKCSTTWCRSRLVLANVRASSANLGALLCLVVFCALRSILSCEHLGPDLNADSGMKYGTWWMDKMYSLSSGKKRLEKLVLRMWYLNSYTCWW